MLKLPKGKHLIDISGLYKGASKSDRLQFSITFSDKKIELLEIAAFILVPYTYPYCFTELIELPRDTTVTIHSKTPNNMLMNHLVTARPVAN